MSLAESITLSWDASPTTGIDGYVIYYEEGSAYLSQAMEAPSATDPRFVRVSAGNVLGFTIGNIDPNIRYRIGVTAILGQDESVLSNVVTKMPGFNLSGEAEVIE